MTLKPFTCVATDLDGTLLNAHSKLSAHTKETLAALAARGIPVIVASGRPFSTIPEEVLALDAVRYIITGNGVRIYDKACGDFIYHCSLAPESLDAILALVAPYPVGYEFFIAGKAYANRAYLNDPARYGVLGATYHYLTSTRTPIDDLATFVRDHAGEIDSIGLSIDSQALKQLLWQRLETEVPDIYVTSSLARLIEIADHRAGKGAALEVVLKLLGLDAEGLVAFGDADNDLGMLRLAGRGVAMAGGAAHLKEAADLIAPPHDEDGVAHILDKLLKEAEAHDTKA